MSVLPCKSVPTDLGVFPDYWRVNYAFGMVMGVDDFQQEQAYHIGRRHLHNRALHGYGVAYGMNVRVEKAEEVATDLQVRVGAGVAMLPGGEEVEITEDHCLRVNDWLAARSAAELEAAVVAGELRVCVTLGYAECLERDVPVPGLPCATDDEAREYSRIRESFVLRLEPRPLDQSQELAHRRFGDVLCRIQVDPAGGPSDRDTLLCLVRDIPAWVERTTGITEPPVASYHPDPPCPEGPGVLRVPGDAADETLQEVFRVWASEVRPQLDRHTKHDESEEDRIVLACLTVPVTDDEPPEVLDGTYALDPSMRPILVNTRAIQELICSGGRYGRNPVRFATLHAEEPQRIVAWLHHPEPLTLAAGALRLEVNGNDVAVQWQVDVTGHLVRIIPAHLLPENARIRVAFAMDKITVTATGEPLVRSMDRHGIAYVSRIGAEIFSETIYSGLTASERFVSVQYLNPRSLELWFHTELPLGNLANHTRLHRNDGAAAAPFSLTQATGTDNQYRWHLTLDATEPDFTDGERLHFAFDTRHIYHAAQDGQSRLLTWINASETRYLGWDGEHTIHSYHVLSVFEPVRPQRPPRLFARLCPVKPFTLRMWLMPPVRLLLDGLTSEQAPLRVLVDGTGVEFYQIRLVDAENQVYDVEVRGKVPLNRNLTRIEVVFDTEAIPAEGGGSLAYVIEKHEVAYLNQWNKAIRAYHLHCCCEVRTCHFVSVLHPDPKQLMLWFHTDAPLLVRQVLLERSKAPGELFEVAAKPLETQAGEFSHLWKVDVAELELAENERLAFHFPVERIYYRQPEYTLLRHMLEDRVRYVCYDGRTFIRAFHAVPPPPPPPPPPPEEPPFDTTKVDERIAVWVKDDLPTRLLTFFDERMKPEIVTYVDESTKVALAGWQEAPERVAEITREVKVYLDSPEAANAMAAPVERYLASETGSGALGGHVDGYLASTEGKAFLRGRVNAYLGEDAGQAALAGRVTDYLTSAAGQTTVDTRVKAYLATDAGRLDSGAAVSAYLKTAEGREVVSGLVSGEAKSQFGALTGDQITPFTSNQEFMRKLAQTVVEFMG